jgi:phospholipase/carboxylesterase
MRENFKLRVKNRHLNRRQFLLLSSATGLSTILMKPVVAQTASGLENQSSPLQVLSYPPHNGGMPAGIIVCLHGSGSKAQALASMASALHLPDFQFIFPNAPYPDPSVLGGKMWYDLKSQDHKGLTQSRQWLTSWLKSLPNMTGIPLESTILSGFSQGGAMALDVGLRLPLAGVVSLGGYLPTTAKPTPRSAFPPVLMVQGRLDKIVTENEAQAARESLEAIGVKVKFREFDIGHEIKPQVLSEMRTFVKDILKL